MIVVLLSDDIVRIFLTLFSDVTKPNTMQRKITTKNYKDKQSNCDRSSQLKKLILRYSKNSKILRY